MWNMKYFAIPVISGATGIVTKGLKKISGNNTRKAFNRFSTKNSSTRNIAHYKESATIRNLKPEWWGSPLVQEEKYQEKPVKREEEIIIIQLNSIHLIYLRVDKSQIRTYSNNNKLTINIIQNKEIGNVIFGNHVRIVHLFMKHCLLANN
jgi:hypothetical protein